MINTGYAELTSEGIVVRIYYDRTWMEDDGTRNPADAPLIDTPTARQTEPRGYCLDITNLSGGSQKATVTLPSGASTVVTFGQGNPVTGGSGRSLTLAQVNAMGYHTRGDIAGFGLG